MRAPRRVTLYLNEDVQTATGYEERRVPHHFSAEEAIEVLMVTLRALAKVLTKDEARTLAEWFVTELRPLQSFADTAPEREHPLKIHEG